MPVIEKRTIQGVPSEIIIKFSLRHKRFEIEFADKLMDISKIDNNLFNFKDYTHIESILEKIKAQYLSKHILEKKQIIISLKTSVSPVKITGGFKFGDDERISGGSGFTIEWWVVEKYIPSKLERHALHQELYKIIEASPNSSRLVNGRINILGQLFMSNPIRVLEYSDELYDFLKSIDSKIETLCNGLYAFFDKDADKFLENIKSQTFLLK